MASTVTFTKEQIDFIKMEFKSKSGEFIRKVFVEEDDSDDEDPGWTETKAEDLAKSIFTTKGFKVSKKKLDEDSTRKTSTGRGKEKKEKEKDKLPKVLEVKVDQKKLMLSLIRIGKIIV